MMYQTIPIQYLDSYLDQGFTGTVVDLRSPDAYCQAHILGSINIPFDELMEQPQLLRKDKPVLFYCSRGSESLLASNQFYRNGYEVVNVANGLNLYRGKYLVQE